MIHTVDEKNPAPLGILFKPYEKWDLVVIEWWCAFLPSTVSMLKSAICAFRARLHVLFPNDLDSQTDELIEP